MRPTPIISLILLLSLTELSPTWAAMTVQVGSGGGSLISAGDDWRFFRGTVAPSAPSDAWREPMFNDSSWEIGPSGFGYGDGDDATELTDMEGHYLTVYLRKEFQISAVNEARLELVIDYDDGFVAYLNGVEVERQHLPDGEPTFETAATSHDAGAPEVYNLGNARDLLTEGRNFLSVEGHNVSLTSTDFSLIPELRLSSGVARHGDRWIVETATVTLQVTGEAMATTRVQIDGQPAQQDASTQNWVGTATVQPGHNFVEVQALDAAGLVLESISVPILYTSAEDHYAGDLAGDTTWSGAIVLDDWVRVPPGALLTVEPGTWVLAGPNSGVRIEGQLLADGTEANPIHWTHSSDNILWDRLIFSSAEDSLLRHCFIEFADCEGDHKDYYDTDCDPETPLATRDYHEAVVVVASHVDFEHCTFRNLPDDGSSGEGDALAVISDDPDLPGIASAHIRNCEFLSIGQGVHTRFAYVLVEGCYFTDHHGDNDDVDLYGESDPPPMIRYNRFLNPSHDDMINPTRCSAVILGNLIGGCDDHGIVLRDKCSPIVINNVIFDCSSAAIAVQNQCDALLINNTIVNCGRGVRLFDHTGRWGPPYCLFPGSGRATLINCIIWDCPTPFELTDSPYEEAPGSHVTVLFSNIQGGQQNASVSPNSTLTWGEGNLDVDPLFALSAQNNYSLTAASLCVDAGTNQLDRLAADLAGMPRPLDGNGDGTAGFDLGAYELLLSTADSNADGVPDGWYHQWNLNPTEPDLSQGDPDQDGILTADEWIADTDPLNPNPEFRIDSIQAGPPREIGFVSSTNRIYTLLQSPNLTALEWAPVSGQIGIPGRGGVDALWDTNNTPASFYQLQVEVP